MKIIEKKLDSLDKLRTQTNSAAMEIIKTEKKNIYMSDYVCWAILNRQEYLNMGFIRLVEDRNYMAAAHLVRLSLDSLIRFYGFFLVKNMQDTAYKILKGNRQMSDLKDKDGQKMKDGYLARKISKDLKKDFEWVNKLYKTTCKFIHFSETHMLDLFGKDKDGKTRLVGTRIADNYTCDQYVEMLDSMIAIQEGVYKLYGSYLHYRKDI